MMEGMASWITHNDRLNVEQRCLVQFNLSPGTGVVTQPAGYSR